MKQFLFFLTCAVVLLAACKKDHKEAVAPLTVSGFLPNSGNPGTVVTIRGTGFSSTLDANEVSFNGVTARVMSANDTVLIVQAPDKGTTGPLTVKNGERKVQAAAYTYQALSIHGISPANGPEGTNIYISGAGFAGTNGPATVTVNGHPAIISNSNDTLLVAIVPAGAGAGAVEVAVNNTHAAGPVFNFQSITAIKPVKGGAGTKVIVTGTGFDQTLANNLVAFNGTAATVLSVTPTSMVVIAPDNVRTGPVSLTVNGQKTAGPVFTQVPAPSIKTVAPLSGPVGTMVTVQGDNFSELPEEDSAYINGTAVRLLSVAKNQLTFTVPAGATTGAIKVVVNGQQVTGPQYTVQALGISQLLPDNGLEGSVISIKGTGFDLSPGNNHVSVNGVALTVNTATDTLLTVTIPNGITTGAVNITTGSLSATGPVFRRAGVSTFYAGYMVQKNPRGMVVDSKGNVYIGNHEFIYKIAPDGTGGVFVGSVRGNVDGVGTNAQIGLAYGLAIDAQDNIYMADAIYNNIRKISPAGVVTTFFSNLDNSPRYMSIDAAGNIYVGSEYNGTYVIKADGSQITQASRGGFSTAFTCANGYVYWSNTDGNLVLRYNMTTGQSEFFAGMWGQNGYVDGPKGTGKLDGPSSLTYDPLTGIIYVIDANNYSIRTISTVDATIGTITGSGGTYQSGQSGYKDGTLTEALFTVGQGSSMAVDKQGNIYVIEEYPGRIRKITLK